MDPLVHFQTSPIHEKVFAYIIVNYRWAFVLMFLLPLSVIYNVFFYFRNKIVFYLSSAPKLHDNRVRNIQRQVKRWASSGAKQLMCTSRPGWQTMSFRIGRYKSTHYKININLIDILNVDLKNQIVRVEPMVTMKQMTTLLLPLGWTLPVVPELDDLTIGGLLMGTGVETSSHRYGLFQHICLALELVLSDGSLVRCTPQDNSDLFYSAFWSYGTLGFLVAAELKIIPACKFVKLTYFPCFSKSELIQKFQKEVINVDNNDFTEGLVFSRDSGVVMVGTMTNNMELDKINAIGKYYKPWFYKHVEHIMNGANEVTEYIPLIDYYHRHSRSIFWEMKDIIPFGNNFIFRCLLGWTIPPKISLLKLTQGNTVKKMYELCQMIQDMLVPMRSLSDSLDLFDQESSIYPLWLCPFKLFDNPGMLKPKYSSAEKEKLEKPNDYVMYVDIGAYGVVERTNYQAEITTRKLEKFVREQGGYQMLYADTFMNGDEFRQMFDHNLYDDVRRKLNCENAFPEVYDKVSRAGRI